MSSMLQPSKAQIAEKNREWLRAHLEGRPHGVRVELARFLGFSRPDAITRMLNTDPNKESRTIKADELERMKEFFGAEDDAARRESENMVRLVGYVGAGAEAHFYSSADDGLGLVPAPDDATETTVAVEIRGTSLGALFERWLVYYDDVRTPVTHDLYGRLCVVGLPNGKVLVKQIKPSKAEGLFHLVSNTEDTMFDQAVDWAARVTSMVPR